MLKLYDYFRSSACFRVRIALHLKNIPYEKIPIHLINHHGEQFSTHYQEINPHSLVPTLQDGEQIIHQSLAIIEYLNETYPSPALLANNPYETAKIRAFALAIAADIHPLNNLRVLTYLTKQLKISTTEKQNWYQHWIQKGFTALEIQLKQNKKNDLFCFGHSPTLADIFLIPQLYNAGRFHCDLSPYPRLKQIYTHCQTLPAFQAAWPSDQSEET